MWQGGQWPHEIGLQGSLTCPRKFIRTCIL
jgi:hypothetical protein